MRTNRKNRRGLVAEINVVPYIDVMLVLLVIFMITAPLLKQSIDVHLPEVGAQTLSGEAPIIITVDQAGHYYLNIAHDPKQPLLLDTLVPQISSALSHATKRRLG